MKRVEKNFRRNDRIGKLTGARGAWKACNTLSVHLLLRPQHGSSARLTDLDQTCVNNYEKGMEKSWMKASVLKWRRGKIRVESKMLDICDIGDCREYRVLFIERSSGWNLKKVPRFVFFFPSSSFLLLLLLFLLPARDFQRFSKARNYGARL